MPADNAVCDADAIRPLRPRDRGDDRHQSHHEGHADREVGQRLGAVQHIFGGDKAGTPEHDENRRRAARAARFRNVTIHLPTRVPDRMLCGQ